MNEEKPDQQKPEDLQDQDFIYSPNDVYDSMQEFVTGKDWLISKVNKSGRLSCDHCSSELPANLEFFAKLIEGEKLVLCNPCYFKKMGINPEELIQRRKGNIEEVIKKSRENMEHSKAYKLAKKVIEKLLPLCEKVEIAGSIRRFKPEVKDIEVVALPKTIDESDGFFDVKKVRTPEFTKAVLALGDILKGKPDTGRYVQIQLSDGIKLDLFIPQESDYMRQYAIRTGSGEFSRNVLATGWIKKGWCGTEDGLRLQSECEKKGENKWVCTTQNPTLPPVWKTEKEFFEWLGIEYIEPEKRS